MSDDVTFWSKLVRDSMELQAQEVLIRNEDQDIDVMKPLQVGFEFISLLKIVDQLIKYDH